MATAGPAANLPDLVGLVTLRWSAAAVVLLATAAVDAAASWWVLRRPNAAGRQSVGVLLAAAAVWCATYGLELITIGRATRELWGSLEYLGTTVLPPAWLVFALVYTGRSERVTRRLLALLAIEPLLVFATLAVPASHDLIRSFAPGPLAPVPEVRLGPAYWLHFGYTNLVVWAGSVLLIGRLLRTSSVYRRQNLVLTAAVLLPLLGNAASSFGLPLTRLYDPTPVTVSLSGLLLVWGVFRYRLLDLLPVARTLIFDRLGDPVLVVDGYDRIVDRNPAAIETLGDNVEIGAPLRGILKNHGALLEATAAGPEIRLGTGARTMEFELVTSPLKDDRGRPAGQLVHLRDITARKQAERRLRWLADYDQLTGLPNRRLLADRLEQAIVRARRTRGRCALLVIDLDRFKLINDGLGHAPGDRVLAEVGARLRAGRRDEDTAARLGGDEFAVLLPEITDPSDAMLIANRVLVTLGEPIMLQARELIVTASAGVAVWPEDGEDAEQLFSCADAAMYRAKGHGRNRAESASGGTDPNATERLELALELWYAPVRRELVLRFQPLIDLRDGSVIGMEALLRWQHPRLGELPPAGFLPVAEENGLTTRLDRWVVMQACEQAARWAADGHPVPVTVNVSAERFRDAPLTLCADVTIALERTGLPAHLLILEISERTIMDEPDVIARELLDLRELGVGVALDDFGAGHTSLTHLRRLPIGMLKIDQELVRRVHEDDADARILSAVTMLAHLLGMTVIAEGVERAEQPAVLRRTGCNGAQGFHFSPPLDPQAAADLLGAPVPWATPARSGARSGS